MKSPLFYANKFILDLGLIYYKGKWAWDIFNVLEGNGSDKIGSIPLIKIEEVSDSRRFRN